MAIELGYWKIRGLGAPLRMILTYSGVSALAAPISSRRIGNLICSAQAEYKDEQYGDFDAWFKNRKPAILAMNPLANLPYIVDGDKCVCQTNAVFHYVGEKFNLNGSTPDEKMDNMQLLNEIYDVRNKMIDLVYPFRQVRRAGLLTRARSCTNPLI